MTKVVTGQAPPPWLTLSTSDLGLPNAQGGSSQLDTG